MCRRPETEAEAEKNANDREKLEGALRRAENANRRLCSDSHTIIAAARKHLDTLPKTKVDILRSALHAVRASTDPQRTKHVIDQALQETTP